MFFNVCFEQKEQDVDFSSLASRFPEPTRRCYSATCTAAQLSLLSDATAKYSVLRGKREGTEKGGKKETEGSEDERDRKQQQQQQQVSAQP